MAHQRLKSSFIIFILTPSLILTTHSDRLQGHFAFSSSIRSICCFLSSFHLDYAARLPRGLAVLYLQYMDTAYYLSTGLAKLAGNEIATPIIMLYVFGPVLKLRACHILYVNSQSLLPFCSVIKGYQRLKIGNRNEMARLDRETR